MRQGEMEGLGWWIAVSSKALWWARSELRKLWEQRQSALTDDAQGIRMSLAHH